VTAADWIGASVAFGVPFVVAGLIALAIGDALLRKDRRRRACYRTMVENIAYSGRPIGDMLVGRVDAPPERIRDGLARLGLI